MAMRRGGRILGCFFFRSCDETDPQMWVTVVSLWEVKVCEEMAEVYECNDLGRLQIITSFYAAD